MPAAESDHASPRTVRSTARRQRAFLLVAVAAAIIATAGLAASLLVKSPAQLQSEQQPPSPSILTAAVQRQQLTQTITVRGTVEAPETWPIRALAAGAGGLRVVTGLPRHAGDTLEEGQSVLEISGRPLIALSGGTPAFRDFTPGLEGNDVTQLQNALVATGDLAGSRVSGRFDWWTQVAVADLYDRLGYTTVGEGSALTLPLSEIAFVPALPATIASVAAELGAPLATDGGAVATVNTGTLQVRAVVGQGQQAGLAVGQQVSITDDLSGRQASGAIGEVRAFSDGSAAGGQDSGAAAQRGEAGYPVIIAPSEPLAADWLAANVRVQITGAQSEGEVLTVPSSGVVTDAGGGSVVVVLEADGTQRRVPVRTGMIVGGVVEVAPDEGALEAGELVVTG